MRLKEAPHTLRIRQAATEHGISDNARDEIQRKRIHFPCVGEGERERLVGNEIFILVGPRVPHVRPIEVVQA